MPTLSCGANGSTLESSTYAAIPDGYDILVHEYWRDPFTTREFLQVRPRLRSQREIYFFVLDSLSVFIAL